MLNTGGGVGDWADLGDMSVAYITRMDCTDGGTLMVWIKRLNDEYGGLLSTLKSDFFTGIRIAGGK